MSVKSFFLILFPIVFSMTSLAYASKERVDLTVVRAQTAVSIEKECLESFVNAKFIHAFSLCQPLAKKGMRDAQLVMGLMYAIGEGTEKNMGLAKVWLTKAAKNGSLEAEQVLKDYKFEEK